MAATTAIPCALASLLLVRAAAAQSQPTADPGLHNPTIADRLLEQQKKRLNTDPIPPEAAKPPQTMPPAVPLPPRGDSAPRAGATLPEGTFIAMRPGRLLRVPTGDAIFVPDAGGGGPMVLQPCATLGRLLAATASSPDAQVQLSGQVFVYHERAYLLPMHFELAGGGHQPATSPAEPPQPPAADPDVADLIKDLESGRDAAPVASGGAPTAATPRGGGTESTPLLTEGTVLVGRRARLVRLGAAGGRYAAAFDNDPDSPASKPLILLPCRTTEQLEWLAAAKGENVAFRLSGRTFVFEGRGYCLPTLAKALRPGDLAPMQ